jgi:hypothetical protein
MIRTEAVASLSYEKREMMKDIPCSLIFDKIKNCHSSARNDILWISMASSVLM